MNFCRVQKEITIILFVVSISLAKEKIAIEERTNILTPYKNFIFDNNFKSESNFKILRTNSRIISHDFCNSFANCYDCINNDGCYWCNVSNSCYYYLNQNSDCLQIHSYISYGHSGDKWFFNQYYLCNRLNKCGDKDYNIEEGDVRIVLKQKLNKNEGCYWEFANFDENKYEFSMKRKGLYEDQISIINYDSFYLYKYVFDREIPNSISNKQETFYFKMVFYRNLEDLENNDFELDIFSGSEKISILSIIMIVGCGLAFLLLLDICIRYLCIHCCLIPQNHVQEIIQRSNNNLLNSVNIQQVFKKFRDAEIHECQKADQLNCTICLQIFDSLEKIVSLPCYHFFHDKCIKNWISNKSEKPTCPNCNFDLLSDKQMPLPNFMINRINDIKEIKENKETKSNLINTANLNDLSNNIPSIGIGEARMNFQQRKESNAENKNKMNFCLECQIESKKEDNPVAEYNDTTKKNILQIPENKI